MKTLLRFSLILGILFLLAACAEQPATDEELEFVTTPEPGGQPQFLNTPDASVDQGDAYPAPVDKQPAPDSGYPGPESQHSVDGRSQSALTGYELAVAIALDEFHPDTYLSAIAPSHIMLNNLGNPPVLPGWFYKFRKPDSRREFIVQVVDTIVTGTTLTESIVDLEPKELAIELSQVEIDSTQVFEQFKEVAASRGIPTGAAVYDLELVNLEGSSGPVWSVVDPFTREWLYSISAVTGEEVTNPYNQ